MRKVFLDDLPKCKGGKGVGRGRGGYKYDWIKSAELHIKVPFIYDDVKGELDIIGYKKENQSVKILYNDKQYDMKTGSFIRCNLGVILGIKTLSFKIEIGQTFKDNKRNLIIIDREYRDNPNNKGKVLKYYKYKCNKCGYNEGWFVESSLSHGAGCACCCHTPRIVVEGINDIPTTAPWMVKFFQGGYDEAKKYTKCSANKIYPICPDCKMVKSKSMTPHTINTTHSIACKCGDGISYNEKFMFNLLEQLNIKFIHHKTFIWSNKKEYDFYFKLDDMKYIIEMDGAQHKKDKSNGSSWNPLEEQIKNDLYKDKLAEEHDINVIRIDCEFSDLEFIKNNILNSKLCDIFDLSNIDWNKCEESALSNICKKASDLWNRGIKDTKEISIMLNISRGSAIKYLKKATSIGWCTYGIKIDKNIKKDRPPQKKPIER